MFTWEIMSSLFKNPNMSGLFKDPVVIMKEVMSWLFKDPINSGLAHLGHFWLFLVIFARWRFFPKNPTLSHITRYGPLTPCYVSEKTNEPILRKLTDRRKDGRKDRQTDGRTDGRTDPILQDPFSRGLGSNKVCRYCND